MNLQQMFDKAVGGIKAQGCLSKITTGTSGVPACYYRYPGNPAVRCAVGHLIPDEVYDPSMEGDGSWSVLANPEVDEALALPEDHDEVGHLLASLQEAHDACPDVEHFLVRAAQIGRTKGLDVSVCLGEVVA